MAAMSEAQHDVKRPRLHLENGPSFKGNTRPKQDGDLGSRGSSLDWSLPTSLLQKFAGPSRELVEKVLPTISGTRQELSLTKNVQAQASSAAQPGGDFMKALLSNPDTINEKGAPAYTSSGDALLDLYVEMCPGVQPETLNELLDKAWGQDPVATLRIIFQARSIHKGKGDKTNFFRAAGWLWEKSPRTLIENANMLADPTCPRPRSKKKDEASAKKAGQKPGGIHDVDDFEMVEHDELPKPEYPPRPHGTFKDLLIILQLALDDQLSRSHTGPLLALRDPEGFKHGKTMKARRTALKSAVAAERSEPSKLFGKIVGRSIDRDGNVCEPRINPKMSLHRGPQGQRSDGKSEWENKILAATDKQDKHALRAGRLIKRLESDQKFRLLYATVLELFRSQLQKDLQALRDYDSIPPITPQSSAEDVVAKQRPLFKMSYAAKYAPSPARAFDKQLLMATALAHAMFPDVDDTVQARENLQRWVLMPLRRALEVPETKMHDWKNINYSRVPSIAMSKNKLHFAVNDTDRYVEKYLKQVEAGSKTISGAAMMPHLLLMDAMRASQSIPEHISGPARDTLVAVSQRVADVQWRSLIDSIQASSSASAELSNAMAVVDVSGSMGGLYAYTDSSQPDAKVDPIWPAIALGIVTATLSAAPWNGAFITFSSKPKIHRIDTSMSLSLLAKNIQQAEWGMSTDFAKVFDLLLTTAKQNNLTDDQMVKRLFVFTDMQFDAAANSAYNETTHQSIQRKYQEAGYTLPELVYWNLSNRKEEHFYQESAAPVAKPVTADTEGVVMISGFSAATLKVFLGMAGEEEQMEMEKTVEKIEAIAVDAEPNEEQLDEKEEKKPGGTSLDMLIRIISDPAFSGLKVYM